MNINDLAKEIHAEWLLNEKDWSERFADFGKTVFLSRSEAEAALAAKEKGGKRC